MTREQAKILVSLDNKEKFLTAHTLALLPVLKAWGNGEEIEYSGSRSKAGDSNYAFTYNPNEYKVVLPSEIVVLNKEYTAEVTKEGVKVGCQTFPLEKIKELADAANKILGR